MVAVYKSRFFFQKSKLHIWPLNFADVIDEKRSSCLINKIRNLTNSLYETYR